MHQDKLVRLLQLVSYLSGVNLYKTKELASKMGKSRSTIYNYYDSLDQAGFKVRHDTKKRYYIERFPEGLEFSGKYINLEEEEITLMIEALEGVKEVSIIKDNLVAKLNAYQNREKMCRKNFHEEIPKNMRALRKAMKEKKTVILINYASNNSGKTQDKTVEPFSFCDDMEYIYAYDVKKRENRVYKISRISAVKILDKNWQYENFHHGRKNDSFHMTTHDSLHVVLEMGTMAKNLLIEEFPSTEYDVTDLGNDRWLLDAEIGAVEGIGRFVIGLCKDLDVIEGEEVNRYVGNYTKNFIMKKFKEYI